MNWLEKIQAPKFYRYMFYKSYQLGVKVKTDDAPIAAEYVMIITSLFQFFFIVLSVSTILNYDFWGNWITGSKKISVALFAVFLILLNYITFIYRKKWQRIVDEFEIEDRKKSKRGFIYLFIYITVSLGLFFVNLWLITLMSPYWQ